MSDVSRENEEGRSQADEEKRSGWRIRESGERTLHADQGLTDGGQGRRRVDEREPRRLIQEGAVTLGGGVELVQEAESERKDHH